MEVYLNQGQFFFVPYAVTEHFLKLATHDQLKILLYVLAHHGQTLSDAEIARQCGVRPENVEEALVFWQQVNVLSNMPQTIQPVAVGSADPVEAVVEETTQSAAVSQQPAAVMATSGSFSMRPSEMAERKESDPAIAAMLAAAEKCAGHLLTHTEMRSLFWMHDYLGLSPDAIIMLLAFCQSEKLFQVRYMEQIAVEWHERNIMTHEQVQQDIQRRTEARSYTGKIMQLFEMTRRPTQKQQSYIDHWQQQGDSLDLIALAYERTREHCDDKLKFSYLDGILKRWRAAGIRTRAQAEAMDQSFYAQKNPVGGKKTASTSHADAPADGEHSYNLEDFKALMNQF